MGIGAGEQGLLAGQVAIITGGASGIGAETAKVLVKQGARVVLVDIQPEAKAEDLLKELGRMAQYERCDVTSEEEVSRVWDKAYSLENRLDIVFNNAGIIGPLSGTLDNLDVKDFEKCMNVNLLGAVLGIKHAARLMKPAQRGAIVCTSSMAGVLAGLRSFSYSVSKAAVIALVYNAAAELIQDGIRVNAVSPGPVPTPMSAAGWSILFGREFSLEDVQRTQEKMSKHPHRTLKTIDVANAVLYLASDLGGFINGHNLLLDAGETTSKSSSMG